MKEIIEDLKRSIECTKSYGLTSIKIQQEEQLINYVEELQQRIDKAIEYIKEYGRDKQLEEEYLMNAYNLAMYNITLLEILGDKE